MKIIEMCIIGPSFTVLDIGHVQCYNVDHAIFGIEFIYQDIISSDQLIMNLLKNAIYVFIIFLYTIQVTNRHITYSFIDM